MSPSRRRVTARCAAWHPAPLPCGMAVRPVSGALGVSRRHALRGYRGRTETPQQNSQRVLLAIFHAHYPGGAMFGRRASRLVPYRHYTRAVCAAITHAHYTACAPRGRAPWCGPVAVGRDVPIAPPRLGAVRGLASRSRTPLPLPSHNSCPAKFARALPDAARCLAAGPPGSRPTAITHRKIRTRWLT